MINNTMLTVMVIISDLHTFFILLLGLPLGKSAFTIDVIIRNRNHQEPRSTLPPLNMKVAIIKYGLICK